MSKFQKLTTSQYVKFKHKKTGALLTILAIVSKNNEPYYLTITIDGKQQAYVPVADIEEHIAPVIQLRKPVAPAKKGS